MMQMIACLSNKVSHYNEGMINAMSWLAGYQLILSKIACVSDHVHYIMHVDLVPCHGWADINS